MKFPRQRKSRGAGIAIIGLAGRFPKSPSIEAYWQNLCQGRELITFFTDEELINAGVSFDLLKNSNYIKASPLLEDYDKFDANFFNYSPREAMAMDPQQRVLLECAWETFERAGYAVDNIAEKVGVFTGSGSSVSSYLLEYEKSFPDIQGDTGSLDHLGNDDNFLSTRISYKLNLSGPSLNVQTACSTSLVAVHLACQSLLNGECSMALAGGVCVRVPQIAGYMHHKGDIHSEDGHCRTFDAKATGVAFGSGAGLVLLKPLQNALKDGDTIYAVITGSAINNDGGHKISYAASSANGQIACILEAIKKSNVSPETIEYVEAHGTGTLMGDPVEISALTQAFRKFTTKKRFCGVGSVKANMGHLDAAAGIAGLIKTVLALYCKKIPPSINITTLNPKINFKDSPFYVCEKLESWESHNIPRRAAVNSLGIGGTNAFVILEESPGTAPTKHSKKPYYLIGISAKTEVALDKKIINLETWLNEHKELSIEDIAYTLNTGRSHFDKRCVLVVTSLTELKETLAQIKENKSLANVFMSAKGKEKPHDQAIFRKIFKQIMGEIAEVDQISSKDYRENLLALANFYADGYDLDWERLHQGESKRKISLPTYPFAQERYWIKGHVKSEPTTIETKPVIESSTVALKILKNIDKSVDDMISTTLVDKKNLKINLTQTASNHTNSLDLSYSIESRLRDIQQQKLVFGLKLRDHNADYYKFVTTVSPETNICLRDHLVYGEHVMPTDAYIEILHVVGRIFFDALSIELKDIQLIKPLVVPKMMNKEIQVVVKKVNDYFQVAIFSQSQGNDSDKILHAKGIIKPNDKLSCAVKQSATLHNGKRLILEKASEVGLGEFYHAIHEINYDDNFAIADLVITPTAKELHQFFQTNCSIILGMLASALSLAGTLTHEVTSTYLPIKIDRLIIYKPLDAEEYQAYLKVINTNYPEVDFDIELIDPLNNLICEMRGLKVRIAPRSAIKTSPNTILLQDSNKAISRKNEGMTDTSKNYLLVKEKVKEKLAEVLFVDVHEINEKKSFQEMGLDSILGVEFTRKLKQELQLDTNIELLYSYPTVEKLSEQLSGKVSLTQQILSDQPKQPDSIDAQSTTQLAELTTPQIDVQKIVPRAEKPIPTVTKGKDNDIAIIGMSGRFPDAKNTEEFWENLAKGVDSVREVPKERWDINQYYDPDPGVLNKTYSRVGAFIQNVNQFEPLFFSITPSEAEIMDPQQRLFLEEAWKAIEDAGYSDNTIAGLKCGVFVGATTSDYYEILGAAGLQHTAQAFTGSSSAILAARISYFLNLKGLSLAIDTACSSSLVAIHLACESLLTGESEIALAGGVSLMLTPGLQIKTSKTGMLSKLGMCCTFDQNADGIVLGEAVGVLVLKPLHRAIEDGDNIYGVIKASGVNQDGTTNGITAPNPEAQAALEIEVYEKAKINPETITYVETHGTGTPLGDPIELSALTKAFRKYTDKTGYCAVGSVKTNIGHTTMSAGVVSIIKVLLALRHQKIPPSLHFNHLNEHIKLETSPFYVSTELRDWKKEAWPRRAAISSFGFSGTNAHMVMEEPPSRNKTSVSDKPSYLITLSAKTDESLKQKLIDLERWLINSEEKLENIAYTLNVGRSHFDKRCAIVASTMGELIDILKEAKTGHKSKNYLISKQKSEYEPIFDEILAKVQEEIHQYSTIDASVYKKKLLALGNLYVKGYDLNWDILHKDEARQKIALPTYPFAREHYWAPKNLVPIATSISPSFIGLHPLIDSNVSTISNVSYNKLLTGKEFYLSDHHVDDIPLMPSVVYLEMARVAGSCALPNQKVISLRNILWHRPITLINGSKNVSVQLYPKSTGVEFEITSHEELSDPLASLELVKVNLHAQGRIIFGDKNTIRRSESLNINDIKKRCTFKKTGQQLYAEWDEKGVQCGPGFQVIDEIASNDNELIARIHMPKHLQETANAFVLHPSILDAALETIFELLKTPESKSIFYLPLSIDEVNIINTITNTGYVYATISKNSKPSVLPRFNIKILNDNGELLIDIKDFGLRILPTTEFKDMLTNYYHPVWESRPINQPGIGVLNGNILVVDDESNLIAKLGEKFPLLKLSSTSPNALSSNTADFIKTLQEKDELPTTIIYCSHLQANQPLTDAYVQLALNDTIYNLFKIAQTLILLKPKHDIKILCINISNDNDDPVIFVNALTGFAKTLHIEQPKISCRVIQAKKSQEQDVDWLLNELNQSEIEVSYANNSQRYVKLYQDKTFTRDKNKLPLKKEGVYLISGGAGGLGLIFARFLAQNYHAQLILIGRSSLNQKQLETVADLKKLGAKVLYIQCDISKYKEVEDLLRVVKSQFNEIHGVLHSAGVTNDAFILKKTPEEIARVLSPKIFGTINLDAITQSEPLDFFVTFSSVASVFGNVGQCDYAYANAFLDSFTFNREMARKNGLRHGKSISINWPLWETEKGMHIDESAKEWLKRTFGLMPISAKEGLHTFQEILIQDSDELLVLPGVKQKIDEALYEVSVGGKPQQIDQKEKESGEFHTKDKQADLLHATEDYLKILLSEALKYPSDRLDADIPFEKYGIDSIMITSLNKTLEIIADDLPKTLFFEYKTLHELANYLIENYSEALLKKLDLPTKLDKRQISSQLTTETRASRLHPLLDTGIVSSLISRFTKLLSSNEFYLKDHIVKNIPTLPGVVYIEMARAAGVLAVPERRVTGFRNISWLQPVLVRSQERLVRIKVYPDNERTAFEVSTEDEGENEPTIHANGQISYDSQTNQSVTTPLNLSEIRERCNKQQLNKDIYSRFNKAGIQFGPGFQVIEELFTNDNEVFAKLHLPKHLEADANQFILHPSLLDGALQASVSLLKQSLTLYLPFNISELSISNPLPNICYVHGVLVPGSEAKASPTFQIQIADETGKILVSIKDFIVRPLQETAKSEKTEVIIKSMPAGHSQDIAIIGISGRYPQAKDLEAFWENLKSGKDCITEIPKDRWDFTLYFDPDKDKDGKSYSKWGGFIEDVDKFDPLFFNISPREAELIDPQERLFLETAYQAVEDAGYSQGKLSDKQVGVFVGVMYGEYQLFGEDQSLKGNIIATSSSYASIANRVSYYFNFHGPSIALDTMCSSSLTALHLACKSIIDGESELAIAGGVNVSVHPNKYIFLSQGKFLSSDGHCHSFGEGGDGYVPGEGVGAVLLKPLQQALADGDHIYGVIKGTSLNHGGKTHGYTVPNPTAQTNLIKKDFEEAGINPATISYIEAHGTGTSLGDPIEMTGLNKVFDLKERELPYAIGSVKSNIGHCESAAGIAALTKVILQMQHQTLVPSIHSADLNPNINWKDIPFKVQHELSEWKRPIIYENGEAKEYPRRASISSFGAGGSNAHVIVEEAPSVSPAPSINKPAYLVTLSAKTEEALNQRIVDLEKWMTNRQEEVSLENMSYTLNEGRSHFDKRCALVITSFTELKETLAQIKENKSLANVFMSTKGKEKPHDQAIFKKIFKQIMDEIADVDQISSKDYRENLQALANFYADGYDLDWERLYQGESHRKISLPIYPFAKKRYWIKGHVKSEPTTIETKPIIESSAIPLKILKNIDEATVDKLQQVTVNVPSFISPDKQSIEKTTKHIIASTLYIDEAFMLVDDKFIELGVDSILGVEIVKKINEEFRLNEPASVIYDNPTISLLSNYLASKLKTQEQIFKVEDIPTQKPETKIETKPIIESSAVPLKILKIIDEATVDKLQQVTKFREQLIDKIQVKRGSLEDLDIAIIGFSGRFPGAMNVDEYWNNLASGKSSVTEVPHERWSISDFYDPDPQKPNKSYSKWGGFLNDVDKFDPLFFSISPADAELMDPQQRLFLEESFKSFEVAGYSIESLSNKKCGVFVGVASGDYSQKLHSIDSRLLLGSSTSILAARISYFLNLTGPCISIETACSSSLVAIHQACQSIWQGECEMALAGGVCILTTPSMHIMTSKAGMLSPEGQCKTFDNSADGFVPGEGVGVVLLKPLEKALKDKDAIYGVIKGSGINQDGATNGITAPSVKSQTQLELDIYEKFNINPKTISYVESHGTGTKLGDPIEVQALTESFKKFTDKKQYCAIGSVKSNIGHTLTAAGVASVIKVLLCLQNKKLVPSINFHEENQHIQFKDSPFYVNTELKDWETEPGVPRRAAASSFGFSGTNAHLIIEEAPVIEVSASLAKPYYLITLSAKTEDALKNQLTNLKNWVTKHAEVNIENLSYTLNIGRSHFDKRVAMVVNSTQELKEILNTQQIYDLSKAKTEKKARETLLEELLIKLLDDISQSELLTPETYKNKLSSLADLYIKGYDINWERLHQGESKRKISLPTYPFAKKRYWCDSYNISEKKQKIESGTPKQLNQISESVKKVEEEVSPYHGNEVLLEIVNNNIAIVKMVDKENRNMFTNELINGLQAKFKEAQSNPQVKVIIITGYGNIFSMGGDKDALIAIAENKAKFTDVPFIYKGLLECELPVIAAIQGHAHGGGFVFGLYADIIIISEENTYSASFMRYGFTPGVGATYIMEKKLGNIATEMMYTAKLFTGAEIKERSGGAVIVRKQDEVLNEAIAIAMNFTEKPTQSLKVFKKELSKRVLDQLPTILEEELKMHEQTFSSTEVKEKIEKVFDTRLAKKGDEPLKELQDKVRLKSPDVNKPISSAIPLTQELDMQSIGNKLIKIVTDILHHSESEIKPDVNLNELGADSIAIIDIVRRINQEYGLTIEATDIYARPTIGSLVNFVSEKLYQVTKIQGQLNEEGAQSLVFDKNIPQAIIEDRKLKSTEKITLQTIQSVKSTAGITDTFASKKEVIQSNDIAIIGISGQFPDAQDVETFWQNLANGVDSVREIPNERWDFNEYYDPDPLAHNKTYSKVGAYLQDVYSFDPMFFKISPREAEIIDPQQRLFLEESWKAIEDAGYSDKRLSELKCGVFVGTTVGDYHEILRNKGLENSAAAFTGLSSAILPARIAYLLNLKGPALSIDTACSSSLVAIHLACESLISGESEMALAGGVSTMFTPNLHIQTSKAGMLSHSGACRTFDQKADGMVLGEGVGVVVLKPLHRAIKDGDNIYGVIKASGMNQDGTTQGITAPNPKSQTALEIEVYEKAKINPEKITYVEAHGTGTPLGDPIELSALTKAFRKYTNKIGYCAVGSVKTNIGHTTMAAGVASLIKVLLCLKNKKIPPHLHFEKINEHIKIEQSPFYINIELKDWQTQQGIPRCAAVSSFGFSGTNAHLVIEEPPSITHQPSINKPAYLITLSAKTEAALSQRIVDLEKWMANQAQEKVSLEDISYTLNEGRSHFDKRCALVVTSITELKEILAQIKENKSLANVFMSVKGKEKPHDQAIFRKLFKQIMDEIADVDRISSKDYRENLLALANFYADGYDLDWGKLHQGESKQRLSMPTYPFAKERYWLCEIESEKNKSQDESTQAALPVPTKEIKLKITKPETPLPMNPELIVNGEDVEIELKKIITGVLFISIEKIQTDKSFQEIGVDSILGVELIKKINDKFQLSITAPKLYDHPTVEALSQYIATLLSSNRGVASSTKINSVKTSDINSQQKINLIATKEKASILESENISQQINTKTPSNDIAIIGMAGQFPGAENIQEFWINLANGKSFITEIPSTRWSIDEYYDPDSKKLEKSYSKWGGFLSGIDQFDPLFFNISPLDAEWMDPQQRLLLQTAWSAIEDAGYSGESLSNTLCGIYVGVMNNDYLELIERSHHSNRNAQQMIGNSNAILPARISYLLNLKGPSIAIDTACSSSLVAIHLACKALQDGEAEMMLAGGVTLYLTESPYIGMSKAGMLSPEGKCKTFDNSADGFVPGEGVGIVVLKRLDKAQQDGDQIYSVIKGSGINQDGKTNGITAPSAASQKELELNIYKHFDINPETISYVEAHGTGTKLGDPIEVEALTDAFRIYTDKKQYCAIGAVKTNIGHTSAAAGVVSVIKAVLCLQHKQLVPSLNFHEENEHLHFKESPFYVNTKLKDWETTEGTLRRAAVSSFGFSGTNAHVVIEAAPINTDRPQVSPKPYYLISLSAKTEGALKIKMDDLERWLTEQKNKSLFDKISLADVSYTLNLGRNHFDKRCAMVVGSLAELLANLQSFKNNQTVSNLFINLGKEKAQEQAIFKEVFKQITQDITRADQLSPADYRDKLQALANFYTDGYDLDWERLYQGEHNIRISLPTYPFAKKRYWIPTPTQSKASEDTISNQMMLTDEAKMKFILLQLANDQLTVEEANLLISKKENTNEA